MSEIGIAMDGRAAIADIPAQARAAEEGGASTLWIACHLFSRRSTDRDIGGSRSVQPRA